MNNVTDCFMFLNDYFPDDLHLFLGDLIYQEKYILSLKETQLITRNVLCHVMKMYSCLVNNVIREIPYIYFLYFSTEKHFI